MKRLTFLTLVAAACGPAPRPDQIVDANVSAPVDTIGSDALACGIPRGSLDSDDHNCGEPCHDCTVCGGHCVAGRCTASTLVADVSPLGIAVDASRVYFVDVGNAVPGSGRVLAIDKTGGTPTELASGQTGTLGVAVDASFVYWTNETTPGAVKKRALAGGAEVVVDAVHARPTFIVASASGVAWLHDTGVDSQVSGGPARDLDGSIAGRLAIDGNRVYYTHAAASGPEELRAIDVAGGAYEVLATSTERAWGELAARGGSVFMTDLQGGQILRVDGGTVTAIVSGEQDPAVIIADDHAVYWASRGAVMRAGHDGSDVTMLAEANQPRFLAVDDRCVYFNSIAGSSYPFHGPLQRVTR